MRVGAYWVSYAAPRCFICPSTLSKTRPTPPNSTLAHRSIRCRILASIGPTWTRPTRSWSRFRASRRSRPRPAISIDDSVAARRYWVRLEGLGEAGSDDLLARSTTQSALKADAKDSANAAQIDRRARADAELLTELLQSQGYYDAEVSTEIEREADRIVVLMRTRPGARYRFETVEFPGLAEAGGDADGPAHAFAVKSGDPVVAQEVIGRGRRTESRSWRTGLCDGGYRRAGHRHRSRKCDREAGASGPAGTGRPLRRNPGQWRAAVQRAPRRHDCSLQDRRPFQQSDVDDLRRALVATGLVASVETKVVPRDGREVVDIVVRLEPAPMRTIAGELGYGTGEGVRAEASWQHRNFFNPEGALTRARRGRDAGAACRRLLPPQQFPAPRPGSQRPDFGQPLDTQCVRREDVFPVRRDRTAEQFHLAEEMDMEPRRRTGRIG